MFIGSTHMISAQKHSKPILNRAQNSTFWALSSGRGGPLDLPAWQASNRVRRRSLSSWNRFVFSHNSATSLVCSSYLASISWHQKRNWSSGGRFVGFLDMTVSSNGPLGCSRRVKASEIGRSPGSGCTQAIVYRL